MDGAERGTLPPGVQAGPAVLLARLRRAKMSEQCRRRCGLSSGAICVHLCKSVDKNQMDRSTLTGAWSLGRSQARTA